MYVFYPWPPQIIVIQIGLKSLRWTELHYHIYNAAMLIVFVRLHLNRWTFSWLSRYVQISEHVNKVHILLPSTYEAT